jgi:hypothetical protein
MRARIHECPKRRPPRPIEAPSVVVRVRKAPLTDQASGGTKRHRGLVSRIERNCISGPEWQGARLCVGRADGSRIGAAGLAVVTASSDGRRNEYEQHSSHSRSVSVRATSRNYAAMLTFSGAPRRTAVGCKMHSRSALMGEGTEGSSTILEQSLTTTRRMFALNWSRKWSPPPERPSPGFAWKRRRQVGRAS